MWQQDLNDLILMLSSSLILIEGVTDSFINGK